MCHDLQFAVKFESKCMGTKAIQLWKLESRKTAGLRKQNPKLTVEKAENQTNLP